MPIPDHIREFPPEGAATMNAMPHYFVHDGYCGWCYGSPTGIQANRRERARRWRSFAN